MYTAQEIHEIAISIIDEISANGTIDAAKTKEYANRAPFLLDAFQKEMVKTGDLFKTFELSCMRKRNLLGELDSFTAVEHLTDTSYEGIGANCFHFSVDGDATVLFHELINGNWVALAGTYITDGGVATAFSETIVVSNSTDTYIDYKGLLTPVAQTNPIRMTFSGNYYYRHANRALCPYKYQSINKIPSFKAWNKIDMPSDFKSRTQVINEYPMWQYEDDTNTKWEGNKDMYVQFGYEGLIRIKYIPIPAKITSLTQTLEIDDISATSGAYYLAEHYAMADQNSELASMCRAKFKALKIDSMVKSPLSNMDIKDVYGVS